jgi:hypothetical protein
MTVRILGAARGRVHGHGDVVEFMAAVVWRGRQVLLVGRWLSVSAGTCPGRSGLVGAGRAVRSSPTTQAK